VGETWPLLVLHVVLSIAFNIAGLHTPFRPTMRTSRVWRRPARFNGCLALAVTPAAILSERLGGSG
jgi:hypothetical protein